MSKHHVAAPKPLFNHHLTPEPQPFLPTANMLFQNSASSILARVVTIIGYIFLAICIGLIFLDYDLHPFNPPFRILLISILLLLIFLPTLLPPLLRNYRKIYTIILLYYTLFYTITHIPTILCVLTSLPTHLKSLYNIQCGPTLSILLTLFGHLQSSLACAIGSDKLTVSASTDTFITSSRDGVRVWCDSKLLSTVFWFRHSECHLGVTANGEGVRVDVPRRWVPGVEEVVMGVAFVGALRQLSRMVRPWVGQLQGWAGSQKEEEQIKN